VITTIIGAIAAQMDVVKAALLPLSDNGGIVDHILQVVTVLGVILIIVGSAWALYGIIKGIASGATTATAAAPPT
jgi:hypothetical protein